MSKKPILDVPSKQQLSQSIQPMEEEIKFNDAIEDKISKIMEFFDTYGLSYEKFSPERVSVLDRKAYPNFDAFIPTPGEHDLQKWLTAARNIYSQQKSGVNFKQAVKSCLQGWKKMEIYDFLNWMRFYQEGTHMKYAQVWYENHEPGYFLQRKEEEIQSAQDAALNRQEEKKRIIENQRKKIIGRLDAAEKLLRSHDGQVFAGPELESLMEAIYALKKKVQLVNKLSVSTKLYEDMIIRESNVLLRQGFSKAGATLRSLAQSPDDPSGAGHPGFPGGPPAIIPGTPNINTPVGNDQNADQPLANALKAPPADPNMEAMQSSPALIPNSGAAPKSSAISKFLEGMNDVLEVEDEPLVVEAQIAPVEEPLTTTPPPERGNAVPAPIVPPAEDTPEALDTMAPKETMSLPATETPLEVSEDDIPSKTDESPDVSEFDAKVDQAFSNLTVADVVAKLEDLAKIFKVREVPRQLAIVDMMLDSLGLASMFPSLSEAQNRALDSNNYISTRIEDILSKLRGAMDSQSVDLRGGPETNNPEVSGVKNKLQQDADKEKQRKQMRKEQENADLEKPVAKETPKVELNDLQAPAAPVMTSPPAPIR